MVPSIVKWEHHHSPDNAVHKEGAGLHAYHPKCLICSFEFSLFTSGQPVADASGNWYFRPLDCPLLRGEVHTNSSFSFLLRAPPSGFYPGSPV